MQNVLKGIGSLGLVRPITEGPAHHFFGFHDLCITNAGNQYLLALEVERIDEPPTVASESRIGYVDLSKGREFVSVGTTQAFNFPQGARQQWLADSNFFAANIRRNGLFKAAVYCADSKRKVSELDRPVYTVDKSGRMGYGIDFSRLHRLGGYGYAGVPENGKGVSAPNDNGIFRISVESGTSFLLLPISEVASFGLTEEVKSHHYITHLVLNPAGNRLAFLHRFRLADGGEQTRLFTVGDNGEGLRLLAEGFLSHFDWADDDHVLIWGRSGGRLAAARQHPIMENFAVRYAVRAMKRPLRKVLNRRVTLRASYVLIRDEPSPEIVPFWPGILQSDGHPMFNPVNRRLMVADTYPDEQGIRQLYLFDCESGSRLVLFEALLKVGSVPQDSVARMKERIAKELSVDFDPAQYAFTRSGLHCDLHPRWFTNGRSVAFDSLHDGTRQIYVCDLKRPVPFGEEI